MKTILVLLFMVCQTLATIKDGDEQYLPRPKYSRKSKFTIEELQNMHFDNKCSRDMDMDPCKAGTFMGDIAISDTNHNPTWDDDKLNKNIQQEVERLKHEVLLEGLQVEEEGLTDMIRKRTKQTPPVERTNHDDNDPSVGINVQPKFNRNSDKNGRSQFATTTAEMSYTTSATTQQPKLVKNLEQEGVLIVNISSSNILTSNTILRISKNTKPERIDYEKKRGKIQSNSREITGDVNGNIHKLKDYPPQAKSGSNATTSEELKNKQRRRRHDGKRKKSSSEDFSANKLTNNSTEKEESKLRKHSVRHGTMTGPFYSRLLKLKMDLDIEDPPDDKTPKSPHFNVDKYNGSVALERVTKTIFRDDIENDEREPKFKKLDIPIHEFEEKFDTKPSPKRNMTDDGNRTRDQLAEEERINWNVTQDFSHLQQLDAISGDKILTRKSRAATGRKERIWEHGVIPYEIDGNFSGAHKALFKQAMRHWENFTCIKFVERQPADHVNYIVFTERQCGCCSFVGKRGNGAQAISIGKNCDKFGIVVHELGHVVGFWHEHTRPDRDNHVQIIRNNIMAGQEYNFNKLTEDEVNTLGQGYDYDSIMHYARNTFSKGTYLDTILPLEVRGRKRPEIGQRVRLSESDIAQTNLLYKCHKCGRTLQENTGAFTSPSYMVESKTTDNEKCEWRITATHGERIVLNVTDLDIFKSDNCQTDYLEVRDGYWIRSPVLGRFCGAGREVPVLFSSGPRLLIHYVSTVHTSLHRGFSAYYEAVCGGELELDNSGGHLESPNYPEDYQSNKECIWKLTVPQDFQVALKFQSFEVENHDNCVYDFVEVKDGHESDSPIVGVFCGYKVPPDIRSTSNKLLLRFVSDGSVQKAGFSATFMKEFDECALEQHGCQHDCINTLGGYECSCNIGYELHSDGKSCEDACGGVFDAPNGTIVSPSFPELYPAGKSCMWEIIAPPQHRIRLNFTHFDLEGNNVYQQECEYDSLTVHSKLGADVLRRQGVYCGSRIPPPLISQGNALRLIFTSDSSIQKSGFSAVYTTDNDECAVNNGGCQHECKNTIGSYTCSCHNGFMLDENKHDCKEGGCKHEVTQPVGTIFSPNYPQMYPSRKDCVWHFTTTPGHRIKLVFNVFEMEPHPECAYDHIVVYDGDSPEALILGRFCGYKIPHPIISNSNQMFMVFKSDASVQRKGFGATHSTVCGGRLMATSRGKHLYSHAKYGDEDYEMKSDCDWTIEAPPGKVIQLTFLTFNLEDERDCGYDYVEVFNGPDASSGPSYGRFCGMSTPTEIISMSESLLIRFRSDETIVFKGFSAAYVAIDYEPVDSEEMAGGRTLTTNGKRPHSKWTKNRSSRPQHHHHQHHHQTKHSVLYSNHRNTKHLQKISF